MDQSTQPEESQRPTEDDAHPKKSAPKSAMTDRDLIIIRELVWAIMFVVAPSIMLSLIIGSYSFQIAVATLTLYVAFRIRKPLRRLFARRKQRTVNKKDRQSDDHTQASAESAKPDDQPMQVLPAVSSPDNRLKHLQPHLGELKPRNRKLSNFAKKRITKERSEIDINTFICEFRIAKSELFWNLDVGAHHNRLIYSASLVLLLGIGSLGFSVLSPLWVPGMPLFLRFIIGGLFIPCFMVFWARLESVLFKTVVLLERDIVFIDMPPIFSGGGAVTPYNLRQVDKVQATTVRPDVNKDGLRWYIVKAISSIAARIGLRWISADTTMDHDAPLPWFGPYRQAQLFVALIDKQRQWAKLDYTKTQQEAKEDAKKAWHGERQTHSSER